MRRYYLFDIKEEMRHLYQSHPSDLYLLLKELYRMNHGMKRYCITLFGQLVNPLPKKKLDQDLFLWLHQEASYSKREDAHTINTLYPDEVSVLSVKWSHLLLTSNRDLSSFFPILLKRGFSYFVADFENQDYFWLNDLKILV